MNTRLRCFCVLSAMSLAASGAYAADIEGTIIINRKLTRPRVTATVPVYQRGALVNLGQNRDDDPLAIERSRVVVYLEDAGSAAAETASVAPVTAVMEQRNREFVPETLVIPVGSRVSFPNADPIFHNIFSLAKAKSFDLGNYPQGETRSVRFNRAGIVFVGCHLHPNMTAAIVVTPNSWNARADRSGHFVIANVPPGRYTAIAWHKSAGFFRQTVEVTGHADSKLEFLIPLAAEPAALEARN